MHAAANQSVSQSIDPPASSTVKEPLAAAVFASLANWIESGDAAAQSVRVQTAAAVERVDSAIQSMVVGAPIGVSWVVQASSVQPLPRRS
jgi:hypothetical protein